MWRLRDDEFRTIDVTGLADRLGTAPVELRRLAAAAGSRYREIALPKPAGGARLIAIPDPPLKEIQARLHDRLARALQAPGFVLGGLRGRSFVDHAERHRGRRFVLTMDLRDFFGSVRPAQVGEALLELGLRAEVAELVLALAFRHGALPQGAPSSPILANLALARLDRRIARLARRRGLVHSRYLDDLAFSADCDFFELTGPIAALARAEGFEIAGDKTACMGREGRQIVTGLLVNDRLRPTPEFYADLEGELRLLAYGAPGFRLAVRVEGRLRHLARFDAAGERSLRRRYRRGLEACTSS